MAAINPIQYPKLTPGAEYLFEYGKGEERRKVRGRLSMVRNKKSHFYKKDGKLAFTKILPDRCVFEPLEEADRWHRWENVKHVDASGPHGHQMLRVHKINLGVGMFAIWSV